MSNFFLQETLVDVPCQPSCPTTRIPKLHSPLFLWALGKLLPMLPSSQGMINLLTWIIIPCTLYPLCSRLYRIGWLIYFFFHTELKDAESTQNGAKAQPILPLTLNSLSKLRENKMEKNFSTEDVRLISKSSLGLMANLLLVHIGKLIQAQNIWKIFSLVPSKKPSTREFTVVPKKDIWHFAI